MIYDIFGDIHGHADMLEGLLRKLGYRMQNGIYRQDDRTPVFVGDIIDRGIQNRRVIEVMRNMVDNGHAHIAMGNHEYNAICYHTRKSETDWLRPHSHSKFKQHENFLREYPLGQNGTDEVINWFKTLPLYLEFDDFRVIHGCWDQQTIDKIEPYLDEKKRLSEENLFESATKDTPLFDMIERILKGPEVKLPDGYSFKDKDGKERHHIRVKWWVRDEMNYRKIAFGYDQKTLSSFPENKFPSRSSITYYGSEEKPVFFGHYWMSGKPRKQADNICCLDYSAGKGGDLVCYRFDSSRDGSVLDESDLLLLPSSKKGSRGE